MSRRPHRTACENLCVVDDTGRFAAAWFADLRRLDRASWLWGRAEARLWRMEKGSRRALSLKRRMAALERRLAILDARRQETLGRLAASKARGYAGLWTKLDVLSMALEPDCDPLLLKLLAGAAADLRRLASVSR